MFAKCQNEYNFATRRDKNMNFSNTYYYYYYYRV